MSIPAPIDREKLLARCLNDTDFTLQMLHVFEEQSPATLNRLREAVDAGRLEDAKRHAHTLKGTAGNLSATGLQTTAAKVEKLANEGAVAELQAAIPEMTHQFNLTLQSAIALTAALKQFSLKPTENQ